MEPVNDPLWKVCASSALVAHARGDVRHAENQYRLSLCLARLSDGSDSEAAAESLINLADFLSTQSKFEEAEQLYRDAISVYDKVYGAENAMSTMLFQAIADLYSVQNSKLQLVLLNSYMLNPTRQNSA